MRDGQDSCDMRVERSPSLKPEKQSNNNVRLTTPFHVDNGAGRCGVGWDAGNCRKTDSSMPAMVDSRTAIKAVLMIGVVR